LRITVPSVSPFIIGIDFERGHLIAKNFRQKKGETRYKNDGKQYQNIDECGHSTDRLFEGLRMWIRKIRIVRSGL
jgi:hypothetical protein